MSLPLFSNSCHGKEDSLLGSSTATTLAGNSVLGGSVGVLFFSSEAVKDRSTSLAYCTEVLITSQTAEKKEASLDSSSSARASSPW